MSIISFSTSYDFTPLHSTRLDFYPSYSSPFHPISLHYFTTLFHYSISLLYFTALFHYTISLPYFTTLFHSSISQLYFTTLFYYSISLLYFTTLFHYSISLLYFTTLFHYSISSYNSSTQFPLIPYSCLFLLHTSTDLAQYSRKTHKSVMTAAHGIVNLVRSVCLPVCLSASMSVCQSVRHLKHLIRLNPTSCPHD